MPSVAAYLGPIGVSLSHSSSEGQAPTAAVGMAKGADAVDADRLLVIAGTCRGAAASTSRGAPPILRGAAGLARGGVA